MHNKLHLLHCIYMYVYMYNYVIKFVLFYFLVYYSTLLVLLKDQYGNYVMQKALDCAASGV